MFPNAIAWGHFQLRGGMRGALTVASVYACATIGFHLLIQTLGGHHFPAAALITILAILQSLSITIFGAIRVGTAIRTDINSHMIESHRLMPTAPHEAIIGYMIGGAAGPLILFATGTIVGAVLILIAHLPVQLWLISNGVMLIFGAFLWCVAAMNSFGAKTVQGKARNNAGMGWLGAMGIFGFTGGGAALAFVPAFMILCSPLLNSFTFTGTARSVGSDAYAVSLASQIAVGAICFYGATRRYSSDSKYGLTPVTALLLIAIWCALSIYAIDCWNRIVPAMMVNGGIMQEFNDAHLAAMQLVGSIIAGGLIALLPINVALRSDRDSAIRAAAGAEGIRQTHWTLGTALLTTTMLCTIAVLTIPDGIVQGTGFFLRRAAGMRDHPAALLLTIVVVFSFIASCTAIMRTFIRRNKPRSAGLALFIYFVVIGGVPIGIDLIRAASAAGNAPDNPLTRVADISPPIALTSIWAVGNADPFPGVMVQLGVALLLQLMLIRRRRTSIAIVPKDGAAGSTPAGTTPVGSTQ